MSPFKDFTEVSEPLRLPINGKTYTIRPVSITDGIKIKLALDGKTDQIDANEDFQRILLGPAYDEMVADEVPLEAVARAFMTALSDFMRGRAAAEIIWETGGDPKAIQRWFNLNQPDTTPSPGTAEANTTPRPASTSGTKTSRSPQRRKPKGPA